MILSGSHKSHKSSLVLSASCMAQPSLFWSAPSPGNWNLGAGVGSGCKALVQGFLSSTVFCPLLFLPGVNCLTVLTGLALRILHGEGLCACFNLRNSVQCACQYCRPESIPLNQLWIRIQIGPIFCIRIQKYNVFRLDPQHNTNRTCTVFIV